MSKYKLDFETPLVVSTNLVSIFNVSGFDKQREKAVRNQKNSGFVDASFEAMMKAVGWKSGQAWCAYFMKLCLMQMFSFDREFLAKNFTASAYGNLLVFQNLNKKGEKRYLALSDNNYQVGDVVCMKNPSDSYGHTFMIVDVLGKNNDGSVSVTTLEGNTSLKGSREGEGAFNLKRTLKIGSLSGGQVVKGYIRRVFTPEEVKSLAYDNNNNTFVFTNATPTKQTSSIFFPPKFK